MEIQHSFIKGLNRDISKDKSPNDVYYYLLNGRVLNDDNNTISDITNVKGNTPANINENSLNRDNYSIIGYTTIIDDIILFYAENTSINVDDYTSYGIIDRLVYNGNGAYTRYELWNGQGLNFRIDKKIRAIARVESENVEKIYWIDNNNSLKHANIVESITGYVAEQFDMQGSLYNMLAPVFSDYTSGQLKPGTIAYAYRFIKKNGYKTTFSDVSEIIPIGRNISFFQSIRKTYGDDIYNSDTSFDSGKGVISAIYINNNDYLNYYDYIEVVSLWYSSDSAIPDINIIDKVQLQDGLSTYRIVDTGKNSYGTLTLAEFIDQQNAFVAKDLVSKDNRLFLSNIKEEYFDLDIEANWTGKVEGGFWDARSYRFDNAATPKCELLDTIVDVSPEYTILSSTSNYSDVLENANAINKFNNITDNFTGEQNSDGLYQKYQSNGTTVGGSGLNIQYEFDIDNTNNDLGTLDPSTTSFDGIIQNKKQLGIERTFQRDEVYRFGIVFFDKKGRQSFVKWIGDIRFPYDTQIGSGGSSGDMFSYYIYPVFTINNIPTIDGDPLDYQIVYVKREESDKSIVASGIIFPTRIHDDGIRISTEALKIGDYYSDSGTGTGHINKYLINFFSPEISFRDKEYINGSFIHTPFVYLYYNACASVIDNTASWSGIGTGDEISGTTNQMYVRKFTACGPQPTHVESRITINDVAKTIPPASFNFHVSIGVDSYSHYGYYDAGGGDNVSAPGGSCLTMRLNSVLGSDATTDGYFQGYLRKNVYQSAYGGLTYNARQSNIYIPASNKVLGTDNEVTCTLGDTFITVFEFGKFLLSDTITTAHNFAETNFIVTESSINCLLRTSDTFSRKYFLSPFSVPCHINEDAYVDLDTGLTLTKLYDYNPAYNKLEDAKKFVSKSPLFENIIENLSTVYYSDLKIDNEDIDSWLSFRSNNYKNANQNYGEINRLVEFNDKIFCFQNNAVSVISINPRVTQQSQDGLSIILGSGEVIDKFNYLTTVIGCQDNSDIIKSPSSLYWLDKNNKKIYTFNGGIESITDLKGLYSYFKNNIYETSTFTGIYDVINSEVLMTIIDDNPKTEFTADFIVNTYYDYDGYPGYDGYYPTWDLLGNTSLIEIPFVVGRTYKIGNGYFIYVSKTNTSYRFYYSHGVDFVDGNTYDLSSYITERDVFTLSYSEKLNAFQTFYSFIPDLYIEHNKGFFSSQNSNALWQHNIGERYNTFYGITYPTTLKFITNLGSQAQAEYTNIKFFSEVWNQYGVLQPNETISNISLKDSTQISEDIILYPCHLPESYDRTKYISDTSGLKIGINWYTGLVVRPEGLVINNNQLYRNTSIGNLTVPPPATGWSIAELYNIRKTNNHWMTNLPRFLFKENDTNDHEYALSNRFRSDWLEVTLEFKDMMPGINLYDRRLRLSDVKLIYTPLQF